MVETPSSESLETTPTRPVEVYMVRHGRQVQYEDVHSPLSAEGEEQAREFAKNLIATYANENVIIKVKRSTEARASKTGEIISKTLQDIVQEKQLTNVRILESRHSTDLRTTGGIGSLLKAGVRYEDSVDEWLANAEKYAGSKKPKEAAAQIKNIVRATDRIAHRLPPAGPKIVYVWVTHETGISAITQELTGKNTAELGGSIGHLETLKINTGKENPEIIFRGKSYSLNLAKE